MTKEDMAARLAELETLIAELRGDLEFLSESPRPSEVHRAAIAAIQKIEGSNV